MGDRFYCADLNGSKVTLTDAEAHHAIHVMRLKIGDQFELFDGAGTAVEARITAIGRRDVDAEILSQTFSPPRTKGRIIVAACLPKGDRQKWMLEKLTEIGVDSFVPLQTERSVADTKKLKVDKLSTHVIAAAKQCRRNWLMNIEPSQSLSQLVAENSGKKRLIIAHPDEKTAHPTHVQQHAVWPDVVLMIGPEGGFTRAEVDAALQNGCDTMAWPDTILRTETAAVVLSALLIADRTTDD